MDEMGASRVNAKKKARRRRHAKTRALSRETLAAITESRSARVSGKPGSKS
jgi:hypothetical protein